MNKMFRLVGVLMLVCGMMLTSCSGNDIRDIVDAVEPAESTSPTISVSRATAQPGDKSVEVAVSVWNNPGVVAMTLELHYDESVLTLTDVKQRDALSEMNFTKPKDLGNGCKLPWDTESVSKDKATNGVAVILRFTVAESAVPGEYAVSVHNYGEIVDNDLRPVTFAYEAGSITVS